MAYCSGESLPEFENKSKDIPDSLYILPHALQRELLFTCPLDYSHHLRPIAFQGKHIMI